MAEAARRLGCSTGVIYHWIHTGQLTARRGSASRFCIPWDAQAEAGCRTRIAQSAHLGRAARPRTLPAPAFPAADGGEISVTQAACRLGCSTGVIYYWIETGQLSARRGAGNRLHIPWNDQVQADCRAASANPGTSTPPPAAPSPAGGAEAGRECRCHLPCSHHRARGRGPDQHRLSTDPETSRHAVAGGAV